MMLLLGRTAMFERTVQRHAPCEMWSTASVIAVCARSASPALGTRIRRVGDERPYPSAGLTRGVVAVVQEPAAAAAAAAACRSTGTNGGGRIGSRYTPFGGAEGGAATGVRKSSPLLPRRTGENSKSVNFFFCCFAFDSFYDFKKYV
ncbi:hypothetical protein Trydic_g19598 [Trypoxylus dichotomus]